MPKRASRSLRIEGDQFLGSKIKRTTFSLKARHHALFNDGGASLRDLLRLT